MSQTHNIYGVKYAWEKDHIPHLIYTGAAAHLNEKTPDERAEFFNTHKPWSLIGRKKDLNNETYYYMPLFWYRCWWNKGEPHIQVADYAAKGFTRSLDKGIWVRLPLKDEVTFETILTVKMITTILGFTEFADIDLQLPLSICDLMYPEAIQRFII